MDLNFTKNRYGGIVGTAPDGRTVLFTIDRATSRTQECVHIASDLPGFGGVRRVDAPEGRTKWSPETGRLAMREAAQELHAWASAVLEVHLDINIVDNT